MTIPRLSACLAALLLAACSASAPPDLEVSGAWARATAPGQSAAAAYLTIANRGGGADRLLGVASPAAAEATLHSSSTSGGVSRMRPIDDGIALPAGTTVKLKPGGTHIMLTGLRKPIAASESIALTLRFERSGAFEVPMRIVEGAAATDDMKGMKH